MVIVGITGTLSSGKETAVHYLNLMYKFTVINLQSSSWEETHPSNA
jgi:dephospho-CoA kinase